MTSKPTEKIIDALTQLLEGYSELQEALALEFGLGKGAEDDDDTDDAEEEISPEVDAALVAEMKLALESVIEGEDFDPEEVAQVITTLTESLEEIDPTVFDHEELSSDESEEEEDEEEYEDDDDLDEDDLEEDEDDE